MKQQKQLKRITVSLCLCILAMVGENTKLAAQDGCPPAQCTLDRHSVCHKECDPNAAPACIPRCVCVCVPNDRSSQMSQDKTVVESAAQNNCPNSKPLLDETQLLDKQLTKKG